MYYKDAVNKYKESNITTEDKGQQIIMLYEGIINLLKSARKAIEENNIQERYNKIQKVIDVLNGMQLSLDHEKGGNVAKILDDFYFSVITRLHLINVRNGEVKQLDNIIVELTGMLEAWQDVVKTSPSSPKGDEDPKRYEISI